MTELPKSREIMRDRSLWPKIAETLHWETETLKITRPYQRWMEEHSHTHSYTEICLCFVGEHFYGVNGKAVKLSPGSAILIPRQVLHDSRYSEHHQPCVDFWIHLLPHGHVTMNFVEHRPGTTPVSTSVAFRDSHFPEDFQRVFSLLDGEEKPSSQTTSFLFYLLHDVLEKLRQGEITDVAPDENSIIANMKEHITKNLADRLPLEELARVAGYSPFHFHRVFTKAEKITPRHFIETHRVKLACKRLETGQSITSAAFDAGFTSCSQFNRVFKKHMKESPTQWIKRRKP